MVFERTPLVPSIQMYSANTAPFWSSFIYLRSCGRSAIGAFQAFKQSCQKAYILGVRHHR